MTLKQLTALRSQVVYKFNHWDEGMNNYHEEPMGKLLLSLIDAEIKRQKPCEDCADGHDILAANKQCEPVTVNYCPNCGRKLGVN